MSRFLYGASAADFTTDSTGRIVPNAAVTVWDAADGGNQITDLLDAGGNPVDTVVSDSSGRVVFFGPAGGGLVPLWVGQAGARVAVQPVEQAPELLAVVGDVAGDVTALDGRVTAVEAVAGSALQASESLADVDDAGQARANLGLGSIATEDAANFAPIDDARLTDERIPLNGSATLIKIGSDVPLAPRNLLTPNQASLEDGNTTGWIANSNGSVSVTDEWAGHGDYALRLTPPSNGSSNYVLSSNVPVTPGRVITVVARWRRPAGSTIRTLRTGIRWYSAPTTVLTTYNGASSSIPDEEGELLVVFSAVVPEGAVGARNFLQITSTLAGQPYDVDMLGLWEGPGGVWAPGGEPIQNLGTYTDESVGRRIFTWDSVNARWQMTFGDTGWRDVTSLIASAYLTDRPDTKLHVRRVGSTVEWNTADVNTNGAKALTGVQTMCTIPAGFGTHASNDLWARAVMMNIDTPILTAWSALNSTNSIRTHNTPAGVRLYGNLSYQTTAAWPTSLPGTAVGSIPQ